MKKIVALLFCTLLVFNLCATEVKIPIINESKLEISYQVDTQAGEWIEVDKNSEYLLLELDMRKDHDIYVKHQNGVEEAHIAKTLIDSLDIYYSPYSFRSFVGPETINTTYGTLVGLSYNYMIKENLSVGLDSKFSIYTIKDNDNYQNLSLSIKGMYEKTINERLSYSLSLLLGSNLVIFTDKPTLIPFVAINNEVSTLVDEQLALFAALELEASFITKDCFTYAISPSIGVKYYF